jgi:ankyrin repeat protein
VIEKQPEETYRATQELMNPYSTASMQILTSYMALLLSNDLIGSQAIDTFLAKAEQTYHQGNIIPLFVQSSPSARAIATQLLHTAVRINSTKFLREAFQSGADLESPSTGMGSLTLLQAALELDKYESARVLIIAGADVNAGSSLWDSENLCFKDHTEGITCDHEIRGPKCPILLAANSSTCVDLIPELVRRGATIPEHNPVLTHAIRAGASADTISCLIRARADVQMCSWTYSGTIETPLSVAAEKCNMQVIRRLLEAGAHPDGAMRWDIRKRLPTNRILNGTVQSPLLHAITSWGVDKAEGLCEIVQLLLDSGADPNVPSVDFLYELEQDTGIDVDDLSEFLEQDQDYDAPSCFYPLQAAVRLDNVELVQLLLQSEASPNSAYGISALAEAISNSNISIARLLLSLGADPDGFDRDGHSKSALVAAVDGENLELVDLLLESGADINNRPAYYGGRTPLQRAAEIGNTRVIDHLLRHGASMLSPPAAVKGISVLYGFVRSGLHDYITRAIRAGVNLNGGSIKGGSPLAAAVIRGDVVSVNLLLAAVADVHEYAYAEYEVEDLSEAKNTRGKDKRYLKVMRDAKLSPIQWAAFLNLVEIATILFEAGADVNQLPFDPDGSMALHLAAYHGNHAIVQLFLERKSEVGALSNRRTALYAAIESGSDPVLDLLLQNGADPNQPSFDFNDDSGKLKPTNPLDTACDRNKISAVRILLANGADMSQGYAVFSIFRNFTYFSESRHLIRKRRMDILELLIQGGADVNKRHSQESTPLQQAIMDGDFSCVDRLIEAGADINASALKSTELDAVVLWEAGRTALQAAASVGNVDLVKRLLVGGADVNAPAAQCLGVTALQAAAIKGYLRIAQILLEYGATIDAPASAWNGMTAIDGAAQFGRIDMVKLLLDNYEGPTPFSTLRNSAYQAAERQNQWYVMELLDAYEHPSEAWP